MFGYRLSPCEVSIVGEGGPFLLIYVHRLDSIHEYVENEK